MDNTIEQLYHEREKRVQTAIQIKEPDRVPIVVYFSFFPARYTGITCQEAMYDSKKMMSAWIKTIADFEPDMYENPFISRFLGRILDILDFKQLRWPGHGVGPDYTYQFLEGEYMRADEYDDFLFDLSDFMVRKYWPRIFGSLSAFSKLPPLHDLISYYVGLTNLAFLEVPEIADALAVLIKAGAEAQRILDGSRVFNEEVKKLGIPPQVGGSTEAPFDAIADFFRGTQGTMLDMYRNPDKLLVAIDKMLPIMLRIGINGVKRSGVPRVFIPLHWGCFMSLAQFKTFYWPTLQKLMLGLIDEGITPCPFFESDYTSRLELIADLPKGKACYSFESTDIFKAKEVLGDHICLRGNVPLSLLSTGTPDDVKYYCKKLIDVVGKGGGFIMDSAVGLDDAKPENVSAMFSFTKEYGVYR